jgi:hypothetical protein
MIKVFNMIKECVEDKDYMLVGILILASPLFLLLEGLGRLFVWLMAKVRKKQT